MNAVKIEAGRNIKMPTIVNIREDNFIEDIYNEINCRCFDIVTINIYGKDYFMFVDDEGLLKSDPQINLLAWFFYSELNEQAPIVGNAIILGITDDESDSRGLTDFEIQDIDHICNIFVNSGLPSLYGRTIDD